MLEEMEMTPRDSNISSGSYKYLERINKKKAEKAAQEQKESNSVHWPDIY